MGIRKAGHRQTTLQIPFESWLCHFQLGKQLNVVLLSYLSSDMQILKNITHDIGVSGLDNICKALSTIAGK